MLQLLYISTAKQAVDVAQVLATSQRNNARHSITGLLYTDGVRFLQVLEGPEQAVRTTFDRIKADPRHRAVVKLSERDVASREFGEWAMAERLPGVDGEAMLGKVDQLTTNASPTVRATFDSFARLQRAA